MKSFEAGGVDDSNDQNIEKDTLDAIKEGNAMPTPEFLSDSLEAKQAFLEALNDADKINKILQDLDAEDREKLVAVVQESIGSVAEGSKTIAESGFFVNGIATAALAFDAAQSAAEGNAARTLLSASLATITLISSLLSYHRIATLTVSNPEAKEILDTLKEKALQGLN